MLILPPGHWQEVRRERTLGTRERWFVRAVVGLLVISAIAIVISLTATGKTSKNGCIDVKAATVIGGSELYKCGAQARDLCSEPRHASNANIAFTQALVAACRKAGLALGT